LSNNQHIAKIDLICDGIENPLNAMALISATEMFGSTCFFHDRKNLRQAFSKIADPALLRVAFSEHVAGNYSPILALDNVAYSADLFAFKLAPTNKPALIVGNERFGISHDMVSTAEHVLHLPMSGPSLNMINVSAAAAIALYYLTAGVGARMPMRADPPRVRPEVLLIGGSDYFELGCTIRSAAAFGWERLFVDDRELVWFGQNRALQSMETESDSHDARSAMKLVPVASPATYSFSKAIVVTRDSGTPLHLLNLADGPQNLIVIPDESRISAAEEDWSKYAHKVEFARIEVPQTKYSYHYRLFASIALAEISRQVGHRAPSSRPAKVKQGRVYDSSLSRLLTQKAEQVYLEDLANF
jgi:tRNA(Leu) C34 or U34 (ribose-2'-O)-methylase TrmL